MGLLFLLLIILLLATAGILGFVVKVALGIAVGLVAAVMLLVWAVKRRVRRALFGTTRPRAQWRRVPGSRVEVLDRGEPPVPGERPLR